MDGTLDTAARELAGEWLTTWSVSPDGSRARLGFADGAGRPCRIDLPVEAVSGLLMTLPRVLQAALDRRGDGNARVVQPLGAWRLERAADPGRLLLTLSTPDGFSVAFALAASDLAEMADAGQAPRPGTPFPARVVN
ncbi:MAG TPA: hypothetical protein VGC15_23145 [Acetobacteraceae bacterium]